LFDFAKIWFRVCNGDIHGTDALETFKVKGQRSRSQRGLTDQQ